MRSIITAKVAFWLIPNPMPNTAMPAIRTAGTASQSSMIMPQAAAISPGISS